MIICDSRPARIPVSRRTLGVLVLVLAAAIVVVGVVLVAHKP
jgi:hypothetical protein